MSLSRAEVPDQDGARNPDGQEALDTLLENCEDAYGFPPYAEIASFLHSGNGGGDLRALEEALDRVPATVFSSSARDWWL